MIIATIGNTKLKLENLKDAEALLNISSRATLVGTSYDSDFRDYQYVDEGEKRITIEVTEGDKVLSFDEHTKIKEARAEKERKAKAAAEAAKAEAA